MPSDLPTKKQQAMLEFIGSFIDSNQYGPSYREIAKGLDYKSVSTVASHVDGLIKKGYLEKPDEYSARSLRLKAVGEKSDKDRTLDYLRASQKAMQEKEDTANADVLAKAIELLSKTEG